MTEPAQTTPAEAAESLGYGVAGEAQEAHFQAALAAAIKEVPPPEAEPEADPITGHEKTSAEALQSEENRQADAEKEAIKHKSKSKEKDEEEDENEDEEEAERPETDKKMSPGTFAKARRLLSEGDVNGALELALGIDLDKVEPTTKQWKGVKRIAQEAKHEAAEAKAFAEREISQARHVVTTLQPFVQAAQHYLKGDYKTFLELATGDTPEQFQKKLIAQLHEAPKSDPAMVARMEQIERERAQEREAARVEREQFAAARAQMQYQEQVQAWKNGIVEELKSSENPVLAKLASKPKFVEEIFSLQNKHLDKRTRTTIDTLEAAEMAYEELYDGVLEPAGGKTGSTQSARDNAGSTERSGKNAGKNIRLSNPSEASPLATLPWSPENQEKILEEAIRKTKSSQAA